MKRFFEDDSGAVLVIFAIVLVALLGVAAIAVDQGYLYDTRRQLQSAADAAALAGCSTLIETSDPGEATLAARQYAGLNANGPGEGLVVDSVDVDMGSEPWSVRVSVHRPVPAWFAGVFGVANTTVHAVSKAEKQPLTGARRLMPWALPVIREEDVDEVEAVVVSDGGTPLMSTLLSHSGDRQWSGPVAVPSTPGGYDLRIGITTEFAEGGGITEWVGDSKGPQPAGRIVVPPAEDYPFTSIRVSEDYGANDEVIGVSVHVDTTGTVPGVSIGIGKKTKLTMSGSGNSWSATLTEAQLPFDDGYLTTFPLDVYVGNKADGFVDAYAHVRRSTYPVKYVGLDDSVASGGSVDVTVELNEFDPTVLVPGTMYTLKVGSDGVETGNFGEINYKTLQHSDCPPDPAGTDLGNNVRDWVEEGYGGGVHVGDIASMSPGSSGWTVAVVEDRIAKYGDVVVVPVVAKYEDKSGGSYDVIVRAFAAFRITVMEDKSTIRGEFIEYVASPHTYGTPGGPGVTVFQARLVNP